MQKKPMRHEYIEEMLEDEDHRNQEGFTIISSGGVPKKESICSFNEPTEYKQSQAVADLVDDYKRILNVLKKRWSTVPLEIQLRYAKFYINDNPDRLRKVNLALEAYAKGEPFDINEIIRFVERNTCYFMDNIQENSECSMGEMLAMQKKKINAFRDCLSALVFHQLEAYFYGDGMHMKRDEKYSCFYEEHRWLAYIWKDADSMGWAHYRWRSPIVDYLKSKGIEDSDKKLLKKSSLLVFLRKKVIETDGGNVFINASEVDCADCTGNCPDKGTGNCTVSCADSCPEKHTDNCPITRAIIHNNNIKWARMANPFYVALKNLQKIETIIGREISNASGELQKDIMALIRFMRNERPDSLAKFKNEMRDIFSKKYKQMKRKKYVKK